jgi:hypothetical protein
VATNSKTPKKSSESWIQRLFSRRVATRVEATKSGGFRKLSPAELKRLGLSETSERYVEKSAKRITKATPTVSKRQYAQKKLGEESGRKVTLEQRAKEYLAGDRQAASAAQAANRERSVRSWRLRKKYKAERVGRIQLHLRNMEIKDQGGYLNQDVYLREKAFAEAHLDVPEERAFYQKWFNYGHTKSAPRGGHNATGRTDRPVRHLI